MFLWKFALHSKFQHLHAKVTWLKQEVEDFLDLEFFFCISKNVFKFSFRSLPPDSVVLKLITKFCYPKQKISKTKGWNMKIFQSETKINFYAVTNHLKILLYSVQNHFRTDNRNPREFFTSRSCKSYWRKQTIINPSGLESVNEN